MTKIETVEFAGSRGSPLKGALHVPEGDAKGSILLAHCFTCSKDLHTLTRIAKGMSAAGYAVFRFDFTGLGESGGEFSETTVSTNVRDLARAAMTLIERGYGPCGMIGHSLGGAATLLAASRLKTVRSMAVIGSPSTPAHIRGLIGEPGEAAIRERGVAVVEISGRPFPLSIEFLEDLEAHDLSRTLPELGRPLLIVHAIDDEIVPVEEGERLFSFARQPKGFVPLFDADHLLTQRPAAEEALQVLLAWFDRTL